MANKKALMYDADTYTPADSEYFRWNSSTESVQPIAPPNLSGYTGEHTGTATAIAGGFAGGTNRTYVLSGHVQVTIVTPGTSSNYVAGDTAVWHLQGVIVKHTTGGSYVTYPTAYGTGQAPTYDYSTSNNKFANSDLLITAAAGAAYLTYSPDVSATTTVAGTVVRIASQLLVTDCSFV
jgi:hypothetical protein